jgi:hypothetical protein
MAIGTAPAIDPLNPELPAAGKLVYHDSTDLLANTPMAADRNLGVFLRKERVEDAYIFCLSHAYTATMRAKFGHAIMIKNPHGFFEIVDKILRPIAPCELSPCVVDDVQYRERVARLDRADGIKEAAFVKPPSYCEECEVRALWIPTRSVSFEPIHIQVPAITPFLAAVQEGA